MRKDGTLRFGDFVSAILHLSDAFGIFLFFVFSIFIFYLLLIFNFILYTGIFESKDPLQNGTIKLSLTEVYYVLYFI